MPRLEKSEKFYGILTACEQMVGGQQTKNVPLAIGLNLYIANCAGDTLEPHDLERLVGVSSSTLERYVDIMESQGMIERTDQSGLVSTELKLSPQIYVRFQSLFADDVV
ncbi:MAG: hypothetical protein ABJD75_03850 [Parasphingorhabdus sp.]|uniref:hypothetical protein n=1 Tax=Parasphingorhabdus sp. TaxID=2709688 RepID=UPI003264BDB1